MSDWIGLFGESLASTCMREGHRIQTLSIMDFFCYADVAVGYGVLYLASSNYAVVGSNGAGCG